MRLSTLRNLNQLTQYSLQQVLEG